MTLHPISQGGGWSEYVPVLTASGGSLALGTGPTQAGRWTLAENLVVVKITLAFGSSMNPGSGTYEITVPVVGRTGDVDYGPVGHGRLYDSSANVRKPTSAMWASTSRDKVNLITEAATSDVSNTVPWTWAQSDRIDLLLTYEPR